MASYRIKLTKEEVTELQKIVNKGSHTTQTYRAACILLNVDEGEFSSGRSSVSEICKVLKINSKTIERIKKKVIEHGIDSALERNKGNRIYEKKMDGDVEAKLIAISCSEPPAGYAKWSLRMLADKMVELKYVESISHVSVEKVLKKTNLSRGK